MGLITSNMVWIWLSIVLIAMFCITNLYFLNKILKKREQEMAIISKAIEVLGEQQQIITKNVDHLRKHVKVLHGNENKENRQRYRKDSGIV